MNLYLTAIQSLLTQIWFFPLLILLSLSIYGYEKKFARPQTTTLSQKTNHGVWIAAFICFIILSFPFWFFRDYAPHSAPDDSSMTLQTYVSAGLKGDSMNWTNTMLGGIDRWVLPNPHPFDLGRIYALFLKPYQLFLLIIGINVLSVFVFSWKIQVEFFGMQKWMAYIGAIAAVLTEGYWVGKYPNAHVSNGHGFAVIIVAIYWLTRFHENKYFWLIAVLSGLVFALGSWTPFHNIPAFLATITIWGLVFWGKGRLLKIVQANGLIILVCVLILWPQFWAMKMLYASTALAKIFQASVNLGEFYAFSNIRILGVFVLLGFFLGIYRQPMARKVGLLFLGFCVLPFFCHIAESLKIIPAFRWELFYAGNEAWVWLCIAFLMGQLYQAINLRFHFAGIMSRLLIISVWGTLFVFTWMGSLWYDLDSSYPQGTWKDLTDSSISSVIKTIDKAPFRVAAVDETNDVHFWGQYQGLESLFGYYPFIDKRLVNFWWISAMMPGFHGLFSDFASLSIPIPVKDHHEHLNFPVPLNALVNIHALQLTNVHWIVSHHPLMPEGDILPVFAKEGQPVVCSDRIFPPYQLDWHDISQYWQYMSCLFTHYRYERPFYVYEVKGTLPRVYLANHLNPWPFGQPPILTQEQLKEASEKSVYVKEADWQVYQNISSQDQVVLDKYQNDYMRLRITTHQNALVVVASTLNPYWHILVGGKPSSMIEVNGFQAGFWVHPQDTKAELVYCPPYRLEVHPLCKN
ncbi:MAG: hypothetical protein HQL13_02720 [Candidatus Omnitrophica bacterium]|nr:hypothetical protein [Candidatus Omnitrophota bacterium]